ncbi:MAG: roadblock/LC7 domain-containing protein [Planctomycetes bacterium]|nr:roadblock/LC7 domain-containing protein [Planctomycetota bacterium]
MTRENKLREDRLVFYTNDVERLEGELDGFLELSGARSAFLIDRDGHLVTRRGEPMAQSLESISALIAGSFAATREMARQMGENEFTVLFHQGARDSIQLQLVGERTLLAIVFDQRTNLGLVRFYAKEAARRLEGVFTEMAVRPASKEQPGLSSNFSEDAAAALDKLF